MSLFRPMISSACRPGTTAARSVLRAGNNTNVGAHSFRRGLAEQATPPPPPKPAAAAPSSSSSNLPLYLGLAGLVGLGGSVYLNKTGGPKQASPSSAVGGALNPKEFTEFVLKEIKPYNHDSATFVFELPNNSLPGLTVASAVVVKAAGDGLKDKDGKEVIRPYTPTTSPDTAGHIDFIVKEYGNGNMSKHFHTLKPGDKLNIKGPIEKFQYKPNVFEHIGMVAGGSGITPMWQVIQAIAADPSDKTKVTLMYTNKSEKDILLREEFDNLAKKDDRFKVVYGLDKMPKKLAGNAEAFEGYVTPELISKHMPAPGKADKVKVFVCGPPGQVEVVSGGKGPKGSQGELKGLLADAGYQPDQVYKF